MVYNLPMKNFRLRKKKIEIVPNPQTERIEVLKAEVYRLENKLKEFEMREKEIIWTETCMEGSQTRKRKIITCNSVKK